MKQMWVGGIPFVLGPIKVELGRLDKKSIDKQIRSLLSEESGVYGRYVRTQKNIDATTSAYFSEVEGYDFGAYVSTKLATDTTENLIYIEEVNDDKGNIRYPCVVIVDKQVIACEDLSSGIDQESSDSWLAISSAQSVRFTVFNASNKALIGVDADSPKIFVLDDDQFTQRIDSIGLAACCSNDEKTLDAIESYRYLDQLVNHTHKNKVVGKSQKNKVLIYVLFVLAAVGAVAFVGILFPKKEPEREIDPYLTYRQNIENMVSPVDIVNIALKLLLLSEQSPGWKMEKIELGMDTRSYTVRFENLGGDIVGAKGLAENFGPIKTSFEATNFVVSGPINPAPRNYPFVIYRFDEIEYFFFRSMWKNNITDIRTEIDSDNGNYFQRQYVVSITNALPVQIQAFLISMADMPIVVNKIEIISTVTGYEFRFNVTIFGDRR